MNISFLNFLNKKMLRNVIDKHTHEMIDECVLDKITEDIFNEILNNLIEVMKKEFGKN